MITHKTAKPSVVHKIFTILSLKIDIDTLLLSYELLKKSVVSLKHYKVINMSEDKIKISPEGLKEYHNNLREQAGAAKDPMQMMQLY